MIAYVVSVCIEMILKKEERKNAKKIGMLISTFLRVGVTRLELATSTSLK